MLYMSSSVFHFRSPRSALRPKARYGTRLLCLAAFLVGMASPPDPRR